MIAVVVGAGQADVLLVEYSRRVGVVAIGSRSIVDLCCDCVSTIGAHAQIDLAEGRLDAVVLWVYDQLL